jgi:hypothetical protein
MLFLEAQFCKKTSAPGGVAAPKILPRDFLYCSFDQKKFIIFSNETDLAVTCCVLHSHGE